MQDQTLAEQLGSLVKRIEDLEEQMADMHVKQQEQLSTCMDELIQQRLQKSCSYLEACRRRLQSTIAQLRRGLIAYWRSSSEGQQQMQPLLIQLAQTVEQFLQPLEA